jgi:WD40 repeat protein
MASPDAAASVWVQREVEHWKSLGQRLPILVLTGGDEPKWISEGGDNGDCHFDPASSTALPPNLWHAYQDEPKWVDLRWARSENQIRSRDPRLRQALAEITAAIENRSLEEMLDLDQRQRLLLRATTASVIIVLAAALLWAMLSLTESRRQLADNYISQGRLLYTTKPARSRLNFAKAASVADSWWLFGRLKQQDAIVRVWLGLGFREPPPVTMWHPGYRPSARFDATGRRVLSLSGDGKARVWVAASGEPLTPMLDVRGATSVDFDASATRIVLVKEDGDRVQVELRDAASGKVVGALFSSAEYIRSVHFSDDRRWCIAEFADGTMLLRDATTGQTAGNRFKPPDGTARLTPDGHRLIVVSREEITVWDPRCSPAPRIHKSSHPSPRCSARASALRGRHWATRLCSAAAPAFSCFRSTPLATTANPASASPPAWCLRWTAS